MGFRVCWKSAAKPPRNMRVFLVCDANDRTTSQSHIFLAATVTVTADQDFDLCSVVVVKCCSARWARDVIRAIGMALKSKSICHF